MNEVTSKLNPEYCRTLILTAVGLGTADTRQKLRDLLAHTLLYHQVRTFNNIRIKAGCSLLFPYLGNFFKGARMIPEFWEVKNYLMNFAFISAK